MASYSRQLLSGSTSGRMIAVAATATPGTLVHTSVAGATAFDEVYVWASNVGNAVHQLTIEWGNPGAVGDHMVDTFSIPANSPPIPIITGQSINGGLPIRAFADAGAVINLSGHVNRIQ